MFYHLESGRWFIFLLFPCHYFWNLTGRKRELDELVAFASLVWIGFLGEKDHVRFRGLLTQGCEDLFNFIFFSLPQRRPHGRGQAPVDMFSIFPIFSTIQDYHNHLVADDHSLAVVRERGVVRAGVVATGRAGAH